MKLNELMLKIVLYFILLLVVFLALGFSIFLAYEYIFPLKNISEKTKKYIFMIMSGLLMSIMIYYWKLLFNKFLNK